LGGPKKQQLTQIAAIAVDSDFNSIGEFNEKIEMLIQVLWMFLAVIHQNFGAAISDSGCFVFNSLKQQMNQT